MAHPCESREKQANNKIGRERGHRFWYLQHDGVFYRNDGWLQNRANERLIETDSFPSAETGTGTTPVRPRRWLLKDMRLAKEFFTNFPHRSLPHCSGLIPGIWIFFQVQNSENSNSSQFRRAGIRKKRNTKEPRRPERVSVLGRRGSPPLFARLIGSDECLFSNTHPKGGEQARG